MAEPPAFRRAEREERRASVSAAFMPSTTCRLRCPRGEILELIGPNGAGKTTMFDLLAGSLPPTSGQIVLNGVDVSRESAASPHRPWPSGAPSRSRARSPT